MTIVLFSPFDSIPVFFIILKFFCKYFILLEDKILALSPLSELWHATMKILICHHEILDLST